MTTTDHQRAAGYHVLAQLLEHGATDVDPELARLFDPKVDPDGLRSEYVAAFDLGIPPFASAFLEAERCVGGRVTAAIGDRMGEGGAVGLAACHVAAQLHHVTALLARGQWGQARLFVHDVLLTWLPTFSVVMQDQPVPFWRAVVRQALDLAAEHAGGEAPEQWSMPLVADDVPAPLGEKSGLADIATWLATPAAVGTFISDADLVAIGRTLDLPRGFGSRPQRIETMLRSAVDYSLVPQAVEGISALLKRRREAMVELGRTHVHPGLVAPWLGRLDRGLEVTGTLAEAAQQAVHATED